MPHVLDTPRGRVLLIATLVAGIAAYVVAPFILRELIFQEEGASGHLIQFVPLVTLIALGWRLPTLAGVLLILLGSIAAWIYFTTTAQMPIPRLERTLVSAILLFPPIFGGAIFVVAGRMDDGQEDQAERDEG